MEDQIIWRKENDMWYLYQDEEVLIQLITLKNHQYELYFNDQKYALFKTQSWRSNWRLVQDNGRELLHLGYNFFDTKGKLAFEDGTTYTVHYDKLPQFSISIYDDVKKMRIISYHLDESYLGHKEPRMSIETKELPTETLLSLLSLGMGLLLFHKATEIDFTTFILLTSQ